MHPICAFPCLTGSRGYSQHLFLLQVQIARTHVDRSEVFPGRHEEGNA